MADGGPRPSELPWAHYPGFFPQNSEWDRELEERRREAKALRVLQPALECGGELAEHGLVGKTFLPLELSPVPAECLDDPAVGQFYNLHTLLEIDQRLRWCRCLLDTNSLPFDRDLILLNDGETDWIYLSARDGSEGYLKEADPLDVVLDRRELVYTAPWYAARALAHARRAKVMSALAAAEGFDRTHEIGLAREWMLFGESFAEGRVIVAHGGNALRGIKTLKAAKSAGAARRGTCDRITNKTLARMKQLRVEQPDRGISWAADAAFRAGFGTSADANRMLWYRHRPKNL